MNRVRNIYKIFIKINFSHSEKPVGLEESSFKISGFFAFVRNDVRFLYRKAIYIILMMLLFIYNVSLSSQKLDDSTYYKILNKKVVVSAVSDDYEPFYIHNPLEGYPGFEVEIVKAYADYLGVDFKVIPIMGGPEKHLELLNKGTADISLGLSINMERGKMFGFSDYYIISTPAGLINKASIPPEPEGNIVTQNLYRSLFDLRSQTDISFSVKANTFNHIFIKNNFKSDFITYSYLAEGAALDALFNNLVNCYVSDSLYIEGILQKDPSLRNRYLPLLSSVQEKHLSIAFKKFDLILQSDLNFFVREMKRSGEINRLKLKYFNNNGWVKVLKSNH